MYVKCGSAGLLLFCQMKELELSPDGETFRLVLLAYDGVGSVQECLWGYQCFGKAGHLNEAMKFIEDIPFKPADDVWECLMNYARIHGEMRDVGYVPNTHYWPNLSCILRYSDGGGGRVCRGKWGPLVAESGKDAGWEEEVRWCDGDRRD
ncbi:pentatricopeptide repeat-containing protein [Tanacetum coccineum]